MNVGVVMFSFCLMSVGSNNNIRRSISVNPENKLPLCGFWLCLSNLPHNLECYPCRFHMPSLFLRTRSMERTLKKEVYKVENTCGWLLVIISQATLTGVEYWSLGRPFVQNGWRIHRVYGTCSIDFIFVIYSTVFDSFMYYFLGTTSYHTLTNKEWAAYLVGIYSAGSPQSWKMSLAV